MIEPTPPEPDTPRSDEAYILRLLGRIADLERSLKQEQKYRKMRDRHVAEQAEQLLQAQARIVEIEKDAERIDWVERYLCRAGEVKNDQGQTIKLARVWSIMGELKTFRETVDAAIDAALAGELGSTAERAE